MQIEPYHIPSLPSTKLGVSIRQFHFPVLFLVKTLLLYCMILRSKDAVGTTIFYLNRLDKITNPGTAKLHQTQELSKSNI